MENDKEKPDIQVEVETSIAEEDLSLNKTDSNDERSQKRRELPPEAAANNGDAGTDTNVDDEMTFNTSLTAAERQYHYFWKEYSPFSQWHPSKFTVDGNKYCCAEQYMMYTKAVLLHDDELASKILSCKDPSIIKGLGREVIQFSSDLWSSNCLHVVKEGNQAKFSQNHKLMEALFSTYPKILVEASPYDKKWGIGLNKKQESAWNEVTWEGLNLLGFLLTELRDEMMCENEIISADQKKTYFKDLTEKLQNYEGQEYVVNERRLSKKNRYADKKYGRFNNERYRHKHNKSDIPDKKWEKSPPNRYTAVDERERPASKSPNKWMHKYDTSLVTEHEAEHTNRENQEASANEERKERSSSMSPNGWMHDSWIRGSEKKSDEDERLVVEKSNEHKKVVDSNDQMKEFSDEDKEDLKFV
ncbi:hypothetical protein ACF0H5_005475 [Mactra antiquata]